MILADTSVWVNHLRRGDDALSALLQAGEVCSHPFVLGELACGNIRNRERFLALLSALPMLDKADDAEVLFFIERHRLMGKGLGLIDLHLLAACVLSNVPLWTADKKLARAAIRIGLSRTPPAS